MTRLEKPQHSYGFSLEEISQCKMFDYTYFDVFSLFIFSQVSCYAFLISPCVVGVNAKEKSCLHED